MHASSCSPPTLPEYVLRTCCGKRGWPGRVRTGCRAGAHLAERRLRWLDQNRKRPGQARRRQSMATHKGKAGTAHLISLPSALSASLTSILIEKKCDDSEMEPTVSASRTCRHIACRGGLGESVAQLLEGNCNRTSFLSFVVSQPSVPPAPSESATHFLTLLRSKALSRCWLSNAKLDSKLSTKIASSSPGISRTFLQ